MNSDKTYIDSTLNSGYPSQTSNIITIVEYVWLDGNGGLRSKTRVLTHLVFDINDIPEWNYDGSSTDQAHSNNSEIVLRPCRIFNCPFRQSSGNNYMVMCSSYDTDGNPAKYNNRDVAKNIFTKYEKSNPWYGLEQEYFIYDKNTNYPLGYYDTCPAQGQYYCSVGTQNAFGRKMVEQHLDYCLTAGINISGINAEVAPGQWEFQIGPVLGIDASDQLWMARYILEKISESYNFYIVYHPKPLQGDWNGSGCHVNFSTENTRGDGGLSEIYTMMDKLSLKHDDHMMVYGKYNKNRMSGIHETSSYDKFTYGVANRQASVRIPSETVKNGKGYFEDRRPAANIDPYQATSIILNTVSE